MQWKSIWNILLKTLLIFIVGNLCFSALNLGGWIQKGSLYNRIYPGRERFPFGENPAQSYNVSVYNLDALFAAHKISGESKPDDEYRVILIGDSSTWGTLLHPEETLAGQLQNLDWQAPEGKHVVFYNLGYPTLSVTKDILILDRAMDYQPDLIIWSLTLESLVTVNQFESPLVTNNLPMVRSINDRLGLEIDPPDELKAEWNSQKSDTSAFSQRRALSDWTRLQIYGFLWAATGLDQDYTTEQAAAARDLSSDESYHDLDQPLTADDLSMDLIQAGMTIAGDVPVLLVNEPILISQGENHTIRYNAYYPIWAYDDYHACLADTAEKSGWLYLDLWNLVPDPDFTNTAVHVSPLGVSLEVGAIQPELETFLQP